MVKVSASRAADPGLGSRLWGGDFSGSSHTSDTGTTLPRAWRYRVSAGTCWSGISILRQVRVENLICNFYLSVAARTLVWTDPSLRYTSMLLERQASSQQTNPVTTMVTFSGHPQQWSHSLGIHNNGHILWASHLPLTVRPTVPVTLRQPPQCNSHPPPPPSRTH